MDTKSVWEFTIGGRLSANAIPKWPCPRCVEGQLELGSRQISYAQSRDVYREVEFEKDDFGENVILGILMVVGQTIQTFQWLQSRFSGILTCNNKECKEVVAFVGRAEIPNPAIQQRLQLPVETYIIPEHFSPPLQPIRLKECYPKDVRAELARSFSVFFSEPNAAGSRLRAAVERLMNSLGIPDSPLHARLEKYSKSEPGLAELLLAIKWLGNEGAHSSKLSKRDVFEGYEVFEHVLDELFVQRPKIAQLKKSASKIVEKYKPK